MPQTSISSAPAIGYAGQIAEAGAPLYCVSGRAEGSGVNAGDPVIRGTLPGKQFAAIGASSVVNAETFAGFVVLETSRPYADTMIAPGDPISVMREGHVLLSASETVAAGEDVGLTLDGGALVGLGAEEIAPLGVVRLPGCQWAESRTGAGLAKASVRAMSASPDSFVMSASFAASGGAGTDIAEQILGVVPENSRIVGAYFVPAAAVTAGTSGAGTDMQFEINKRTKAAPATQVAVANGSNVDADSHAFEGDGAIAQWESSAFTLVGAAAECGAGDVLTFEVIAGASASYPAGSIFVELRKNG